MKPSQLVRLLKDARPHIDAMLKQAAEAFEKHPTGDRGIWCIAQVEATIIGIANCVERGLAWDIFKSCQPDYESLGHQSRVGFRVNRTNSYSILTEAMGKENADR